MKNPTKNTLPSKVVIQIWTEIESFPDKQVLKNFIMTKSDSQELLNKFLQAEKKQHQLVTRKHVKE